MRKNFGAKAYTYPQPVFIIATYGEDGTPDAMNAAACDYVGIASANKVADKFAKAFSAGKALM